MCNPDRKNSLTERLQTYNNLYYITVPFCALLRKGTFFSEDIMADNKNTRVAVMGIIVENTDSTESLNAVLHEYGNFIIGRMGVPYREKKISIVSIALDAPQDIISTLSGKIGKIPGISVKTAYSNVITNE